MRAAGQWDHNSQLHFRSGKPLLQRRAVLLSYNCQDSDGICSVCLSKYLHVFFGRIFILSPVRVPQVRFPLHPTCRVGLFF